MERSEDIVVRRAHFRMIILFLTLVSLAQAQKSGVEVAGDILQIALPVYAGGHTLFAHDPEGALQFGLTFTSTIAVVYILKYTVNRERPNGGDHSFPSGHAASAFASSSFLWRRYGWKIGVPATALATFVGFSRVYADKHYPTDVLVSAALAVGSSFIFTNPRELSLEAIIAKDLYGVEISGVFGKRYYRNIFKK